MNCTFFGHANTPAEVKSILKEEVIKLIETRGADRFYVGNHGSFDRMALSVLKELSEIYPQIDYCVVYAYLPRDGADVSHSVYPEGIENVPKRFAINFRNNWLIQHADIVVTFVTRSHGGAAKFKEISEKKGREVVELKI